MKSIGKVRRATTAAMDSPYREGFDAGRNGDPLVRPGPLPLPESEWIDYRDGWEKGRKLWMQCEKAAGRIPAEEDPQS